MIGHETGKTPTRFLALAITLFTLALSGCGGGSGSSSASIDSLASVGESSVSTSASIGTISGVAAIGLPLAQGTVTIKDATGTLLESANIDAATGIFTLTAVGGIPPYFLKAEGKNPTTQADVTLYSIAIDLGTANINPLTHLIVATAAMNIDPGITDPADLFTNPTRFKGITSTHLTNATAFVMANLPPEVLASLQSNSAAHADPIRDAFTVGKGLDKVFDSYAIHLDGASGRVEVTDLQHRLLATHSTSTIRPLLNIVTALSAGSYYYSSQTFGALFVVGSGLYCITSEGTYSGGSLSLDNPADGFYTARFTFQPTGGVSRPIVSHVLPGSYAKQFIVSGIAPGGGDLTLTWAGDENSAIFAADAQNFLIVDQAHNVTLNHDPAHKLTYSPKVSLTSDGDLWLLAPGTLVISESIHAAENSRISVWARGISTGAIPVVDHTRTYTSGEGQALTGNTALASGNLLIQNTPDAIVNWNTFNITANNSPNFIQSSGSVALNGVTAVNPTVITGTLTSNIATLNPSVGGLTGSGSTLSLANLGITTTNRGVSISAVTLTAH